MFICICNINLFWLYTLHTKSLHLEAYEEEGGPREELCKISMLVLKLLCDAVPVEPIESIYTKDYFMPFLFTVDVLTRGKKDQYHALEI